MPSLLHVGGSFRFIYSELDRLTDTTLQKTGIRIHLEMPRKNKTGDM